MRPRTAASHTAVLALLIFVSVTIGSPADLSNKFQVKKFTEELLYWPDMPGPVGIRIKVELTHPPGMAATMLPPQIVMGNFDSASPPKQFFQEPFYEYRDESGTVRLSVVKAITYFPDQNHNNAFLPGETTSQFVYDLFPGNVLKANAPAAFCLFDAGFQSDAISQQKTGSLPDSFNHGKSLGAYWVGMTDQGLQNLDLSALLAAALRKHSSFEGKPEEWQAMHKSFMPEALRKNRAYERAIWKGHELCYARGDLQPQPPNGIASKPANLEHPAEESRSQLAALRVAVEAGHTDRVVAILDRTRDLGTAAEIMIPYLVEMLANHSALADQFAITLAKMGQSAVGSLLPLADHPNPEIRRRALSTIGMIVPTEQDGIDALVKGLDDEDQSVRRFSAFAMVNIANSAPDALPKLERLAKNDVVAIRHSATTALGSYGGPAVPTLAERLANDENKSVRIAAVRGLLQLGPLARDVEPVLRSALNDSNKYVREYAEKALANLSVPPAAQ